MNIFGCLLSKKEGSIKAINEKNEFKEKEL